MGYEENEPQINADERGFVASNPSHLISSWDLAFFLFLSLSYVFASTTYRRVGFYGFGVIILEDSHLREWCGEHFWAPSCFHGLVGNGWNVVQKYISEQDVYEYNRENEENDSYRPRTICPGYTVTAAIVILVHPQE